MREKRVIIFMPSIEGGGVEKNLFIITNFLTKKYSNLSLITVSKKFSSKFNNSIKLICPRLNIWDQMNRRVKYIISIFLLIKEILNNRNSIVFSFQANIYCIIICKIFFIKIITRSNSAPAGWSNNIFKKMIFRYFLKLSNKIIVNSYEFKKNLKNYYNLESTVILNPLKKSKTKKKILFFKNFNQLKIISIGRLTHQKDHITLLKSLKLLKYNFKVNFRLYLIGKGYNYNLLTNFIKNHGLKKNIKLAGYKKNAFEYIKSSDLLVLSSRYEGLPNVLIEAQASGIPVISSNCPSGPREILMNGKLGELFKVGDYKGLCNKIFKLFENKKILKKKSILEKKYLYRYDHNTNLKKYTKILKDNID